MRQHARIQAGPYFNARGTGYPPRNAPNNWNNNAYNGSNAMIANPGKGMPFGKGKGKPVGKGGKGGNMAPPDIGPSGFVRLPGGNPQNPGPPCPDWMSGVCGYARATCDRRHTWP